MSQYMEIYVRDKDTFIELMAYCRSSDFYRIVQDAIHVPYEKIKPLTDRDFNCIYSEIEATIKQAQRDKLATEMIISDIGSWNNNVDEKMDKINVYRDYIIDYNETIDTLTQLKSEIEFYEMIMRNRSYLDSGIENSIYIGIEVGEASVEDIE